MKVTPLWKEDDEFQRYRAMVERDPVGAQAFAIKTLDETRQTLADHCDAPLSEVHGGPRSKKKGTCTDGHNCSPGKRSWRERVPWDLVVKAYVVTASIVILVLGGATAAGGS